MTERASMSGKVLDKYELLDKVGEGGMAEVYRGRHLTLGREVAVKVLHPHLSSTERNRIRFEREAHAIVSLEHDHILRIFDYSGKDSQLCYIVTEFIEGSTLKELLGHDARMPSEIAAMIALELCDALEFAHAHGIIHRDIKPENVMIRRDGVVKLMDFGIARVLDDSTTTLTGGLVGSPAYMSPEQASDKDVDIRSDIFSMGTLLYRTVTGHLPFVGRSTPVILRNIIDGNFADPQDVEPGIAPLMADIIRKTLEVDPDLRYRTASELGQALRQLLEQSQVSRGQEEIRRYLEDRAGYEEALTRHLSTVLTEQGRQLIEAGNSVTAMKLFNRVLYLDEHNDAVKSLIQGMHQPRPRFSRYLLASLFVLCIPLGAVVALGVAYQETLWPASGPRAPEVSGPVVDADAVEPEVPEPTPPAPPFSPPPVFTEPRELPSASVPTVDRPLVTPSGGSPGESPRSVSPRFLVDREQGSKKPHTPSSERPGGRTAPVSDTKVASASTPAVLHLMVDPPADVVINKKRYGNSVFLKPIPLPPGRYQIELVNALCEPYQEEVLLEAGKIRPLNVSLTHLPARLYLKNFEPGTELSLDGKRLGLFASIDQPVVINAPRNRHRLIARMADGTSREWPLDQLDPNAEYTVDASSGH